MDDVTLSQELCSFIEASPTAYHAAAQMCALFNAAGFSRLQETEAWNLARGGSYYVVRNEASVIAFRVGENLPTCGYHLQMSASHTDSPMPRVKHIPELDGPNGSLRLNVEIYGGMLDATWLDRPLGLAGRVMVRTNDGRIESRLVATKGEVALIPNVAIHQRRDSNQGFPINRQVDLPTLISAGDLGRGSFDAMVAQLAGVEPQQVLGKDLYLVNRTRPRIWGWADEFVSAPRLDDLQCAYASLKGFLAARNDACITLFACFDNEEIGSGTMQGALSTFLRDTLVRVNAALGFGDEDLARALAASFMVSCDNSHAVHPNHPELYDAENCGRINGGVVVKEVANQKYTTDGFSRAVFTAVCHDAGVPVQTFANRSDNAGGATLGNLSNRQVSVHSVDIGLAQLAMHSSYETAGARDTQYLRQALQAFYEADVRIDGDGRVML